MGDFDSRIKRKRKPQSQPDVEKCEVRRHSQCKCSMVNLRQYTCMCEDLVNFTTVKEPQTNPIRLA